MGKAVTACSTVCTGEGQGREQSLDLLCTSRGSRDVGWICSAGAQRALESREDGGWCGGAEIQRDMPGKVGEGWSTDEAFEPKAGA